MWLYWRNICQRVRGCFGDGEGMAQNNLTTARGAALYIGAILGPGLLLPGLAAAEAGPASILAWLALLGVSLTHVSPAAKTGRSGISHRGRARPPRRPQRTGHVHPLVDTQTLHM